MAELRIGIIDSNDEVIAGRSLVMNSQSDMRLVFSETDGRAAIDRAPDYLVDVMVVGVIQHGFENHSYISNLCQSLHEAGNECVVLSVSAFANTQIRWKAILGGAQEHIGLDEDTGKFLELTRKIVKKDFLIDTKEMQGFVNQFGGLPVPHQLAAQLEVMDLQAKKILNSFLAGNTDATIAKSFDMATIRVTKFLESLLSASGFTSRNQLAISVLGASK